MAGHAPALGPGSRKRGRDHTGASAGASAGDSSAERPAKHVKRGRKPRDATVKHALLAQYYLEIQTLRQYALSELPSSSRIRRRKIASVGLSHLSPDKTPTADELALGELLDATIVARRQRAEADHEHRWQQWVGFSQKGDESYVTLSDGLRGSIYSQSEIVDFVVWLLFSREGAGSWPKHTLCDGFRKQAGQSNKPNPASTIPGLYSVYPNQHVQTLKQAPWPQFLMLLGKEGERIMIDLLVDCAIFRSVTAGKGNLYQLCGTPISELGTLTQAKDNAEARPMAIAQRDTALRPSDISFARNRMLYARAALNTRGLVQFGLRHIHVLNRFPYKGSPTAKPDQHLEDVTHIMMYLFPRQFGLHNVFTSAVDRRQTAQRLQDYTLREEEIAAKFPLQEPGKKSAKHVPRRLRGDTVDLVQRLQVLHSRCSYAEMLHHYCPIPGQADSRKTAQATSGQNLPQSPRPPAKSKKAAKGPKPLATPIANVSVQYASLTELATPAASISAFCQAVISRVIPDKFWGQGSIQEHNKTCFLRRVDHFVHLRRFESMYLHELMQGMKINDIEWLAPPGLGNQKSSQSDTRKRTEIFYEFLYYLIDSFLIPLIRSNFYVTESNVDRYRLFFFRHDVWRYVAEPALAVLKTTMFEEVRMEDARQILQSRRLGYSQVRLLPKQNKMRPIMNLRRRTLSQGNKKLLGPSINSILGPVSSVLKLEKTLNPSRLGASLFSVGDVYQRIKAFKNKLGDGQHKFYFAKVDVQAAFDTIPQGAMIELLKQIPQQSHYKILKHAEVALLESSTSSSAGAKPTRRWHTTAATSTDARPFPQRLEEDAPFRKKNDTVFVNNSAHMVHHARDLVALTSAHVQQNLVRVGKKYYRQKAGIPQGSVLSSTLCNYFYADLERRCLPFLACEEDCLLMRLIDDFLLITTDREKARRFVEVMHGGLPEYGVVLNAGKSLANFELAIGGVEVPRVGKGRRFPYCGLLIDCGTLAVAKGREGVRESGIFNSLTVEYSRCPGKNFKRKVINTFKIQSHLMFFDTSHNSRREVLTNIYSAFVETATKMWAYARCLASRPGTAVLIDTVKTLIDVAFVLLTSRVRRERYPGYVCCVKKDEVAWLAMVACRQVLVRKQAGYRDMIVWLEEETRQRSVRKGLDVEVLVGVAKDGALMSRRTAEGKGH